MANTYTQLNIHVVFAVKGRKNLLTKNIREELFKYLSGILTNTGQFSLAINGFSDHVHLFFEMQPSNALSDIVRIVKANSSKWINEQKFIAGKFMWQEGFGAFSYSRSQRDVVINYIKNQEKHHTKSSFKEEYFELLRKFEIEFKDEYVFEFYE